MPGSLGNILYTPPHSYQGVHCPSCYLPAKLAVNDSHSQHFTYSIGVHQPEFTCRRGCRQVVGKSYSTNLILPLCYHYTNCSCLIVLAFLCCPSVCLNYPSLIASLWTLLVSFNLASSILHLMESHSLVMTKTDSLADLHSDIFFIKPRMLLANITDLCL